MTTDVGWPQKTADSTFSTAAVSDLFGGRDPVIVAGSDSIGRARAPCTTGTAGWSGPRQARGRFCGSTGATRS